MQNLATQMQWTSFKSRQILFSQDNLFLHNIYILREQVFHFLIELIYLLATNN